MSAEDIKKKPEDTKVADTKKQDSKKKSKFRLKKKEKKVVVNGKAYVNATFNNLLFQLPTKMAMFFPGHLLALRDLKVQENLHHMLHKLQLMMRL